MQTKGFTMPRHCEILGLHYQIVFLHTSLHSLGTSNFESHAKFDVPNNCKEVCKKNSLIMQTKRFTMPGHCETLGLHYQTFFLHISLHSLGTSNFESNALIINALGINN